MDLYVNLCSRIGKIERKKIKKKVSKHIKIKSCNKI